MKGLAIVQRKNVLDLNDLKATFIDNVDELLKRRISFQLVSLLEIDQGSRRGKLSEESFLHSWISNSNGILTGESQYTVEFKWSQDFGIPGALIVTNKHHNEFFLRSLTLEVPSHGSLHFDCNSWVYPKSSRVFFSNKSYLPCETPFAIQRLRDEELVKLRGDGIGERKVGDRIYDYDVYNDLGEPDKNSDLSRPVLGGSPQYPYPRRGRTGRPATKTEPQTESRLPLLLGLEIYVPRDERFSHVRFSDCLALGLKSIFQFLMPAVRSLVNTHSEDFKSVKDMSRLLYKDGISFTIPSRILEHLDFNLEFFKALFTTDGQKLLKFPLPDVISKDESAWRLDTEFARETIAGVNPLSIQKLESFPPKSKLGEQYATATSCFTYSDVEKHMEGVSVKESLKTNKLFIVDHYDDYTPYLAKINSLKSTKIYATRTILFLRKDGTLKPVGIELSLPPQASKGEGKGYQRALYPSSEGVEGALWQMAKTYAAVNDSGQHQLISHWLRTHAVIEPFVIAANRQLSVMHPIHKLMRPHFKDTMNINAIARHLLINGGGILEMTVFPGKFAMELSSVVYKDWCFNDQALPTDLIKRGMAERDERNEHGLRLVMEDYPYAVDGLEIWGAIETWVDEYVSIYYTTDEAVKEDAELKSWWTEVTTVGHGDKKDATWWYAMQTREELKKALTTIIWVASALHAAVNFGQYLYAGFMPNRPTMSRRLLPHEGSEEYEEMLKDPDSYMLKVVPNKVQTALGIALIELLSRHSADEVYLGQREGHGWTDDKRALEAFERFGERVKVIERNIMARNKDPVLKNRRGPVEIEYTLLFPTSSALTITGKGIPNSTST